MFRYTAEREIQAPIEQVFAFLSDVTRQTEWVHGVTECHWEKPGPVSAGAMALQSMTFMGKPRIVPMKLLEYEPGRKITFEKAEPFPIRYGFELEAAGGSTRVRYPVEMDPKGLLFRVVIPLVGKKTIHGDLDRIAGRLEKRG
jgi:carbon monoxide dehydrogenase subunit G